MLADPRSEALVSNFAAQWLHLRNLDEVKAEPSVYPEFDQDLVDAFRQETALFIGSTIEEDRSVLDLLGADYTYVNERLARHYDIPGVYGSRFRRVTLPDLEQRGGLLGHGSLLSLTSYPHRTSPVLRGRWLLEAIFGAPPPGPPPDVPALPERGDNNAPASMRERLELHRRNPACASCHRTIDPPGFMLEHYDAIGRWRSVTEEGRPVDAAGTLPNGVTAVGLAGLRGLLLEDPEQFVGTLTERLLAYALGREPQYYDQPTVRRIVRNASSVGSARTIGARSRSMPRPSATSNDASRWRNPGATWRSSREEPRGVPSTFEEHVELIFDLQFLALQSDITRVTTFMLGREQSTRTYPEVGVNEPHHPLSHHGNDPAQIAKMSKVNTYHAELTSRYLERLRTTPDQDGSLLDNMTIMYGTCMSNSTRHAGNNVPILVLGGGAGRLKGGRHLQYGAGTTHANLLLTLLDKFDVRLDRVGGSTGALPIDEINTLTEL